MADFHGAAIERFSKLVTRHSNLREAIRQALAHDRKGESLQAVATLESALAADEAETAKDSA